MKCPTCGAAELIHDTRDETYTYKGVSTLIAAVTGDFCPACDESIHDSTETERVMKEMAAFQRQVNAAFVPPASSPTCAKSSPSTSAKRLKFLAVALTRSRAMKPAKPSPRWRW